MRRTIGSSLVMRVLVDARMGHHHFDTQSVVGPCTEYAVEAESMGCDDVSVGCAKCIAPLRLQLSMSLA